MRARRPKKSRPLTGCFTGKGSLWPCGRQRYLLIFFRKLWEYTEDPADPLTYHKPNGARIRACKHMITDMGSVPLSTQMFISKDGYLKSYIIHDSGYEEQGLWVARPGSDEFKFVHLSRLIVDDLLRACIRAQGGNGFVRNLIHRAVRIGGGKVWKERE